MNRFDLAELSYFMLRQSIISCIFVIKNEYFV
jgi:hypothetical protein